ncbi:MAG: hypothetical protein QW733_06725 [Desulfurococcaceae archaeon]
MEKLTQEKRTKMLTKAELRAMLKKVLVEGREDYWLKDIEESGIWSASLSLGYEIERLVERAIKKNKHRVVEVFLGRYGLWRELAMEILYDLIEEHKEKLKKEGLGAWEFKLFLITVEPKDFLDNIVKMPIRDERYVYIHRMDSYYAPRYRRPKFEGIELLKTGIWDRIFAHYTSITYHWCSVDKKGFLNRFASHVDTREIPKTVIFYGVEWSHVDRLEEMLQVKSGVEGLKEKLVMIVDKERRMRVGFERFYSDLYISVNFSEDKYDYSEILFDINSTMGVFQNDINAFVDYVNYLLSHVENLKEDEELKREIIKAKAQRVSIEIRDTDIEVGNKQLENKLKSYVINNRLLPKDYLEARRIEAVLDSIMKISL